MASRHTDRTAASKDGLYAYLAVRRAQHRYGFDLPTAQRLAFVCWLRLTGRLSEWDPR